MAVMMANYLLTEAQIAVTPATFTSAPINIEKAGALAVHTQALVGVGPDITYTYTLSSSKDGTFVPGEATIKANRSAIGVDDFAPEAASWIKIIITNNAAAVVTPKVVLAVQEI